MKKEKKIPNDIIAINDLLHLSNHMSLWERLHVILSIWKQYLVKHRLIRVQVTRQTVISWYYASMTYTNTKQWYMECM